MAVAKKKEKISGLKIPCFDLKGKKSGAVDFPEEMIRTASAGLIHQVVVAELANLRRGTHKVKNRGEVRGGGKKPWKQKGTGRARAGSSRSPIWRGGGVAFGPQPRSYRQRTPKKMKRIAILSACTSFVRQEKVKLIDIKKDFEKPSARKASDAIGNLASEGKVLFLHENSSPLINLSLRNLYGVEVLHVDSLHLNPLLKAKTVIFTREAFERFAKKFEKKQEGAAA